MVTISMSLEQIRGEGKPVHELVASQLTAINLTS
jgi:hypothetical protein